jgi:hypothetical protein
MQLFTSLRMKIIKTIKNTLREIAFTRLSNYREVVWLIGSGRSGTTWVSNLINHDKSYRELFEPFHPKTIKYVKQPILHKYIASAEHEPDLEKFANEVFTGKFTIPQIDKGNKTKRYNKLLVKDISVNLFAHSLFQNYPFLKVVLLIRNPFAVALSKIKTQDWGWMNNPQDFLKQEKLVNDFLTPFVPLINKIGNGTDPLEKQILIWCIINYIPLKQFNQQELLVIFYEDFLSNPTDELARINNFISNKDTDTSLLSEALIKKPSKVTTSEKTQFEIDAWKREITEEQFSRAQTILKAFGFDQLYLADGKPNPNFLMELQKLA